MAAFAMAIVAVLLFAFGMVLGAHLGEEYSKKLVTRVDYWRANGIVFAVGAVAACLIWASGFLLLVSIAFGLMVGMLSGLKMGFGESIGPWGFVDGKLGTNKDQVRRAKNSKHAEAVRRARKEGTPEPEVISVVNDANDTQNKGGRPTKRRSGGSR